MAAVPLHLLELETLIDIGQRLRSTSPCSCHFDPPGLTPLRVSLCEYHLGFEEAATTVREKSTPKEHHP